MNESSRQTFPVRQVALYGLLLGILFVSKRALDFLPNVELVTLLFILYARHLGKGTYLLAVAFTGLECIVWGVHNWVIMYLYMWPLLITLVLLSKKRGTHFYYCILSACFGLFFGLLCSIPYLVAGGPQTAFAWWIAGIPYDIIHCVANFALCLFLYKPLDKLLTECLRRFFDTGTK